MGTWGKVSPRKISVQALINIEEGNFNVALNCKKHVNNIKKKLHF
jgi:hypothetical protein